MQHARPVGPATNDPAAFGVEMVVGSRPDRSRAFVPPKPGWSWFTPEVAPFPIESVLGAKPDRARPFLAPRIPLPVSQPTHVAAPLEPAMSDGAAPDRQRYIAPFHQGWQWVTPDVQLFSVEMAQGELPDRSRAWVAPKLGWHWWTPEVEAFPIESTFGAKPERARIQLGPRIALPVSQPTHTVAGFSIEMSDGWQPDRQRYTAPLHSGWQWVTPEVLAFSVEMALGNKPDRPPRLGLGPKIPLPESQPSHVPAAFDPAMADGWLPDRQRYTAPLHAGWQWLTTTVEAFSIDMVQGVTVLQSRYEAPLHGGWQGTAPDVSVLIVEQAQGARPDRPRLFLGPRLPLPWAQPTHTAAPFSGEMAQGSKPAEKSHAFETKKVGWSVSQPTHTAATFTSSMTQGVTGAWFLRRNQPTPQRGELPGNHPAYIPITDVNPAGEPEIFVLYVDQQEPWIASTTTSDAFTLIADERDTWTSTTQPTEGFDATIDDEEDWDTKR